MSSFEPPLRPRARQLGPAALAMIALGLAAACGDADKIGAGPTPDAGPGADATTPEATSPSILYVERVFTPTNDRFYYLSALPDVPTAPVDRTQAVEAHSADPEVFGNRVYVRDRDQNTMTRYRVTDDRALVADGSFSFAPTALAALRFNSIYVSATRAYLMDSNGWRLIGWDPTKMELTGEIISIAAMNHDPLPGSFSAPVKVGDVFMAAVSWVDASATVLTTYPGSGILVFDPASSAPPTLVTDPRIAGGFRITAGAAGDAFLTGITSGVIHAFGKTSDGSAMPTSGVVRLAAGQTTMDPAYLDDVEAITHTVSVGAIHRISDTALLAQIYDPDAAVPTVLGDFTRAAQYIYVLIDTAADTFTAVDGLAKGVTGNAGNHVVDGALYFQISTITKTSYETDTYAASPRGVAPAFHISGGDLWFMARIR